MSFRAAPMSLDTKAPSSARRRGSSDRPSSHAVAWPVASVLPNSTPGAGGAPSWRTKDWTQGGRTSRRSCWRVSAEIGRRCAANGRLQASPTSVCARREARTARARARASLRFARTTGSVILRRARLGVSAAAEAAGRPLRRPTGAAPVAVAVTVRRRRSAGGRADGAASAVREPIRAISALSRLFSFTRAAFSARTSLRLPSSWAAGPLEADANRCVLRRGRRVRGVIWAISCYLCGASRALSGSHPNDRREPGYINRT